VLRLRPFKAHCGQHSGVWPSSCSCSCCWASQHSPCARREDVVGWWDSSGRSWWHWAVFWAWRQRPTLSRSRRGFLQKPLSHQCWVRDKPGRLRYWCNRVGDHRASSAWDSSHTGEVFPVLVGTLLMVAGVLSLITTFTDGALFAIIGLVGIVSAAMAYG
jgi:hypothetical protein